MKTLRIMLLMHEDLVPPEPDRLKSMSAKEIAPFKTERDVWQCLIDMGHEVLKIGVYSDLGVIRDAIEQFKPHIAFNLVEDFHGIALYDQHVVSFLELMKKPYTGCNPRGLLLSRDKALSKSVLSYHRIRTPEFAVFPVGSKVRRPRKLEFPLLVKSQVTDGSVGISQASIVHDDETLRERVEFVHRHNGTDAIAERYIDGREFYVGVIGNERLQTLPIWEMTFENLPEDAPAIATSKVKWDVNYQKRVGVKTHAADDLSPELEQAVVKLCKRAYKALSLTGFARMDLRFDREGQVHLIEANPNPQLAKDEDFAESAAAAKMDYEALLSKIISLGLSYRPAWREE